MTAAWRVVGWLLLLPPCVLTTWMDHLSVYFVYDWLRSAHSIGRDTEREGGDLLCDNFCAAPSLNGQIDQQINPSIKEPSTLHLSLCPSIHFTGRSS